TMAYAHHPVMVREDSEWEDIDDMLEYAKENPGSLKWGSGGIVNPIVLAGREMFQDNNIDAKQVPYDGGAEVIEALLADDIDMGIVADFKSSLDAGDIKLLAEATDEADPNYPDVKTLEEEGLIEEGPPYSYGIVGPDEIPTKTLDKLNEAIETVINSEEYKEQLDEIGVEPFYKDSEEYEEIMVEEDKRLEQVVPEYSEEGDDE